MAAIIRAAIIRAAILRRGLRPAAMDRIELALGALEHVQPARALGMLVVITPLVAAQYLVRPGRQLGQRDGRDRYLRRQFAGIDPPAQDQDVRVEKPLRIAVTGHTGW
jgi:hypothetical protein